MLAISLPASKPSGMVRSMPQAPSRAIRSMLGVCAYSSGVFPPSFSIGSSAIPSPRTTIYFNLLPPDCCLHRNPYALEGALLRFPAEFFELIDGELHLWHIADPSDSSSGEMVADFFQLQGFGHDIGDGLHIDPVLG